jgi:hypothetical protein
MNARPIAVYAIDDVSVRVAEELPGVDPGALPEIVDYMRTHGCRTVILEFDYVDPDFLSEHAGDGPYRLLPVSNRRGRGVLRTLQIEVGGGRREATLDDVTLAIVPTLRTMWLRADEARAHALLGHLRSQAFWDMLSRATDGAYPKSLIELAKRAGTGFVVRWRLISSKFFQGRVLGRDGEAYRRLSQASLPDLIWVGELIEESSMSSASSVCVRGEIVVDATANPWHPCVLAVHLPGLLCIRNIGVGWDEYAGDVGWSVTAAPSGGRPDLIEGLEGLQGS